MILEPIVRHARLKWLVLGVITFALATWLYFGHFLDDIHPSKLSIVKAKSNGSELQSAMGLPWPAAPNHLWTLLQPMLDDNAPNANKPSKNYDVGSPYFDQIEVDKPFEDGLSMPSTDVLKMRDLHTKFVANMSQKLPSYFPTQKAPKRGIVTVAGGYHFPIFFVSLRMLRRTGTNLPIEVFLPTEDDYEPEMCEEILPQYNAKCITLTSVFNSGDGTHKPAKGIVKFQYKIFSILFSSFEEVLFLDSDSFPLQNPDPLFDSAPFKETGMITWPDIWAISTSPIYYLISNQPPPRISERASMESGQIMVSKKRHHQTLVLSSYYNYHGPDLYYDLLCQGGNGIGDKETFHPAATALGLPLYAVGEAVKTVGHAKTTPPKHYVFAMIQYDPLEDYERTKHGKVVEKARPFFLHANTPKWNPKNVLDTVAPYMLTKDIFMEDAPAYQVPEENVAEIPGVESQMWEEAIWVGCELEDKFKDFAEKLPGICSRLREYFDGVLKHRPDFANSTESLSPNTTEPARRISRRFVG
ncbi:MAG: hypothetical protein LQ340_006432 [Diploschistes diacapsis]|nr:MAG: hypothetical protein LQ340_006432 [Diploschistes diacapsis]